MVRRTRLALFLAAGLLGCADSPHIFDFSGGSRACQAREVCNGLDDDCDGVVDELPAEMARPRATNQVGQCGGAAQVCEAGQWREPGEPEAESVDDCDGLDNDCDGQIDESFVASRRCPMDYCDGQCCEHARLYCVGGDVHCLFRTDSDDYWLPFTGPELCDGFDNDCDEHTDEGFGLGDPCDTVTADGVCARPGVKACGPGGAAECVGVDDIVQMPVAESCNGSDDDCDGRSDEAVSDEELAACAGTAPHAGCVVNALCNDGELQCAFSGTDEVCDGADNDCDGQIDEPVGGSLGCAAAPNARGVCEAGECATTCTQDFRRADDGTCATALWREVGLGGFGDTVAHWCGLTRPSGAIHCWRRGPEGDPIDHLGLSLLGGPYDRVVTTEYDVCARVADGGAIHCAHGGNPWPDEVGLGGLAAAGPHVCGVTAAGDLACTTWGAAAPGPFKPESVSVGAKICAVRADDDESAVCWDGVEEDGTPRPLALPGAPLHRLETIRVGLHHFCVRRRSRAVSCWAFAGAQPQILLPEALAALPFEQLTVGDGFACGLTLEAEEETVKCWTLPTAPDEGQAPPSAVHPPAVEVDGLGRVGAVHLGPLTRSACAIGHDGAMVCWSLDDDARQPVWRGDAPAP